MAEGEPCGSGGDGVAGLREEREGEGKPARKELSPTTGNFGGGVRTMDEMGDEILTIGVVKIKRCC